MKLPRSSIPENNRESDGPWAWSRGQSSEEQRFEEERRTTKQLAKMIDEGVSRVISSQSRVKSQWEKTLQGESREYLDQIHQETIEMRSSGAGTIPTTGPHSVIVSAGTTALDERRLLLKRKQLERQKLAEASPHLQS